MVGNWSFLLSLCVAGDLFSIWLQDLLLIRQALGSTGVIPSLLVVHKTESLYQIHFFASNVESVM